MNVEKLRRKSVKFCRKQRRKMYLKAYKELKSEIRKESNIGNLYIRFTGRFNYAYAVAARLFYRKNKGFYVKTRMEENYHSFDFTVSEIYINWNKEPILEEIIVFSIHKEEEEEDEV